MNYSRRHRRHIGTKNDSNRPGVLRALAHTRERSTDRDATKNHPAGAVELSPATPVPVALGIRHWPTPSSAPRIQIRPWLIWLRWLWFFYVHEATWTRL